MTTALKRQEFLKAAVLGTGASATSQVWPSWMPRMAFAAPQENLPGDVLVVLFLRGAADVLNLVVPHGEEAYYAHRPTLGIPRPDDRQAEKDKRAIDLDGIFGLNPSLSPILPIWQAGHLGVVVACGAPDESRSHFKAQELMERGVEDERGPASGWVGRHLASLEAATSSPVRAIGLGQMPQRSLRGAVPVTALRSITDFHFGEDPKAAQLMQSVLTSLYAGEGHLNTIGQETLELLDTLQKLKPEGKTSNGSAAYPQTDYGRGLKQIATLVKAEVGLEVAAIDLGGWDTHFAQGGSQGLMANLAGELAQGLAAFYSEMIDYMGGMTLVVMTEFGRRTRENGSLGTDHGHGAAMLLVSGHVLGGMVHGQWPGLEQDQLTGPGDLAVTTDYRDVLAEVCLKRLNNSALEKVFPGFNPTMRGLFKS